MTYVRLKLMAHKLKFKLIYLFTYYNTISVVSQTRVSGENRTNDLHANSVAHYYQDIHA